MECKEIRVDVRTASIKESTEGQRQTKILFQINHTMPFTDEYNHLLKELFGNNLGDGQDPLGDAYWVLRQDWQNGGAYLLI